MDVPVARVLRVYRVTSITNQDLSQFSRSVGKTPQPASSSGVPEWTGPFDVEVDCVAVTKERFAQRSARRVGVGASEANCCRRQHRRRGLIEAR
jgi:hypothetical protein